MDETTNIVAKSKKLFRFSILTLVILPLSVAFFFVFFKSSAQIIPLVVVLLLWLVSVSVVLNAVIKFIQERIAPRTSETETKPPFQYTIRALMVWTALIAVFLALARQAPVGYTIASVVLFLIGLSIWLKSIWPIFTPIIILIPLGLLAPSISAVREPARRNTCSSNIRQLALAMYNFESAHGYFPSQNFFGNKGQGLSQMSVLGPVTATNVPGDTSGIQNQTASYSFITQLLPQFEEGDMFENIQFDKNPFDTTNGKYCGTPIPVLQCPSFAGRRATIGADYVPYKDPFWTAARKPMLMQYVAMGATTHGNLYRTADATAPEPDGMIFSNKRLKIGDVLDGMANTIMLCETREEKYAVWMDGTTASVFGIQADGQTTINWGGSAAPYIPAANFGGTEDWQWGPSSMHAGMAHHAFGDGAVRSISNNIIPAVYEALITRGANDAEKADLFFGE